MKVETLDSFPAGENPFLHDHSNMGTPLGTNVIAMHQKFDSQHQPWIVLIDIATGERVKVTFAEEQK